MAQRQGPVWALSPARQGVPIKQSEPRATRSDVMTLPMNNVCTPKETRFPVMQRNVGLHRPIQAIPMRLRLRRNKVTAACQKECAPAECSGSEFWCGLASIIGNSHEIEKHYSIATRRRTGDRL